MRLDEAPGIELRHLRYFVAVAEELSFSGAASRSGVSQSTLSTAIQQLERLVGVQLIERTTRHAKVTAAGEAFLEEAREALARVGGAVEMARDAALGGGGRLVVSHFGGVAGDLPAEILRTFDARHPGVRLELKTYGWTDPTGGLTSGGADAAFVRLPLTSPDLELEPLFEEPVVAMLPADHRLATSQSIEVAELFDDVWIEPATADVASRAFWLALESRGDAPPRLGPKVDSLSALLENVVAGRGVALTTPSMARSLGGRGVAYVLVDGLPASVSALAWRADASNAALALLVETARDVRDAMLGSQADSPAGPAISIPCRPIAAWWEYCSPGETAEAEPVGDAEA